MASTLKSMNYGKSRVRVAKIVREGERHQFADFTVDVRLQGSFEDCYLVGDNSMVVPTDTMKNTVYAIASLYGLTPPESFALALARHFLNEHAHVRSARIDVVAHDWHRLDGFTFEKGAANGLVSAEVSREGAVVESGLDNLILLKTTKSAFTGFLKDKYTTLKETNDRILATSLRAVWRYGRNDVDYAAAWTSCRKLLVHVFTAHDSLAVQQTLYAMGSAVLDAHPEISEIRLAMPNKHYLPVDLRPLGLENKNEIFLPTDEPHGQIEATLQRGVTP